MFSWGGGSKSAKGGPNPLADMDRGGPNPLAGPNPRGVQIRCDTGIKPKREKFKLPLPLRVRFNNSGCDRPKKCWGS